MSTNNELPESINTLIDNYKPEKTCKDIKELFEPFYDKTYQGAGHKITTVEYRKLNSIFDKFNYQFENTTPEDHPLKYRYYNHCIPNILATNYKTDDILLFGNDGFNSDVNNAVIADSFKIDKLPILMSDGKILSAECTFYHIDSDHTTLYKEYKDSTGKGHLDRVSYFYKINKLSYISTLVDEVNNINNIINNINHLFEAHPNIEYINFDLKCNKPAKPGDEGLDGSSGMELASFLYVCSLQLNNIVKDPYDEEIKVNYDAEYFERLYTIPSRLKKSDKIEIPLREFYNSAYIPEYFTFNHMLARVPVYSDNIDFNKTYTTDYIAKTTTNPYEGLNTTQIIGTLTEAEYNDIKEYKKYYYLYGTYYQNDRYKRTYYEQMLNQVLMNKNDIAVQATPTQYAFNNNMKISMPYIYYNKDDKKVDPSKIETDDGTIYTDDKHTERVQKYGTILNTYTDNFDLIKFTHDVIKDEKIPEIQNTNIYRNKFFPKIHDTDYIETGTCFVNKRFTYNDNEYLTEDLIYYLLKDFSKTIMVL